MQNILNNSSSYDELFKKLNLNSSKSLIKMLRYRTKIENISHEKFNINAKNLILNNILKKHAFKEKPLEETEKKEVSGYLKVISEYRQKIRQMKHRIKEEEGIKE